ncbi:MAG: fumarate hydratase, partial [Actinobacteria bacterium]|nr:fumarate hydratase [Actinomycetota bacterium]
PICQDTGLAVVFVEQGHETCVGGGLAKAITQGVTEGYEQGYLRKSVVAEPLDKRCNTGTNGPAIIHHEWVAGSDLKITLLAKGGGAENRSRLVMLKPSDGREGVLKFVIETVKQAGADACPPFVVGVGIGGNFEVAPLLAKRALLRKLNSSHPEDYYAKMEHELLVRINALGIGPQGLGGDTTALGVLIETAGCHIASLPVAVNIECHAHRHKSVTLKGRNDG